MIIQGDCLIELKKLPSNSVDSIVTDPPYELGFMGKSWDKTGISNNVLMWSECLRVLKPAGHLLAFSGTRTYHRMASAIEDAGFEVRDMIEWVYGSGFPKSLNIGKAVDKLQGNEREYSPNPLIKKQTGTTGTVAMNAKGATLTISKGNSEWEGWGTALKPAHEPICMARKPLVEKTVAENVLKWGTGGINIDESRVGTSGARFNGRNVDSDIYGKYGTAKPKEVYDYGRFPANLIHDNSDEVRECFPETKTGKAIRSNSGGKNFGGENTKPVMEDLGYDDTGGNASRFFKSIIYNPKASKSERNKGCEEINAQIRVRQGLAGEKKDTVSSNFHPTVKPIALMEYLIKMVTLKGGTVLDPFMGSGSTGVAAKKNGYDFIGIELDKEYCEIAEKRINSFLL